MEADKARGLSGFFTGLIICISSILMVACSEQSPPIQVKAETPMLEVYKSETCGCCGDWITHVEEQNIKVNIHHPEDMSAVKAKLGIPDQMQSCHTGVSQDGYIFEGHVPVKFIQQFLNDPPPNALGLTVPGMPVGSPGMEMGDRFQPYSILVLGKDGNTSVYAQINSYQEQF